MMGITFETLQIKRDAKLDTSFNTNDSAKLLYALGIHKPGISWLTAHYAIL